jgi:hypothetical protein
MNNINEKLKSNIYNKLNNIDDKLNYIIEKLNNIDSRLTLIENSTQNMDHHISFVENVYDIMKYPMTSLLTLYYGKNNHNNTIENIKHYRQLK